MSWKSNLEEVTRFDVSTISHKILHRSIKLEYLHNFFLGYLFYQCNENFLSGSDMVLIIFNIYFNTKSAQMLEINFIIKVIFYFLPEGK